MYSFFLNFVQRFPVMFFFILLISGLNISHISLEIGSENSGFSNADFYFRFERTSFSTIANVSHNVAVLDNYPLLNSESERVSQISSSSAFPIVSSDIRFHHHYNGTVIRTCSLCGKFLQNSMILFYTFNWPLRRRTVMQRSYFASFLCAILLAIGGIELNPGPLSPSWSPWDNKLDITFPLPRRRLTFSLSSDDSMEPDIPNSTFRKPVLASANVNSLPSKLEEIKPLLQMHQFAAFAVQETKIDSKISQSELKIPGYQLFRRDRNRRGGGVALYVLEQLKSRKLKLQTVPPSLEIIAVEITFLKHKLIVASVYNPKKDSAPEFIDGLSNFLAEVQADPSNVMVLGDTNRDFLTAEFDIFDPMMDQFSMRQIIQEPTHKSRCIDQVFATFDIHIPKSGTACPIEKFHAVTWAQLSDLSMKKSPPCTLMSWKWNEIDFDQAQFLLGYNEMGESRDLPLEIEECPDVDSACNYLTRIILEVQQLTVPHKVVRLRNQPCPWMSKQLLRSLQRRDKAYRAFKRTKTAEAQTLWVKLKKKAKWKCKEAKRNFVSTCFQQCQSIADYWKIIRKLLGQKEQNITALTLEDGTLLRSAKDQAEGLSDQFQKNWNHQDQEEEHVFSHAFLEHSWYCTEDDVLDIVQRMDSSASIGLDGISPRFLKACAVELAPSVAALLNKCLIDGDFPQSWKHSRITAIPKVPGTNKVSEMRPISILPVLSKIGEQWLKSNCRPYLMNKAHDHQFAYLQGRSTEDAIALAEYYITSGYRACQRATRVAVVSLDVAKAFDSVPKNKLLHVLRVRNGLPDGLARLLHSYLSNRRQTVQYGGELSGEQSIISGVPQGSILGPHLFTSYIDAILDVPLSTNSRTIAFSDDLLLIKPIIDQKRDCMELQQDIDMLIDTYGSQFLRINPAKSKHLLCTLEHAAHAIQLDSTPKINGIDIEKVASLKYLGVFLDPSLSFKQHVEKLAVKAKRATGALHRSLGKWSHKDIFKDVYTKKILPLFLYAIPVATPSTVYHSALLEKVNRFAGRLIENNYSITYQQLLQNLGWKSISRIMVERQLLLAWKYNRGQRFLPFGTLADYNIPARLRQGWGRHERMMLVNDRIFCGTGTGRTNRQTQGKCPFYSCIDLWNGLSPELVELDLPNFKRAIKNVDVFQKLHATHPTLIKIPNIQ